MKKINFIIPIILLVFAIIVYSSCSVTSSLSETKSGAQLWGESCLRCHNAPSPKTFSDSEWDTAIMHMQIRAYLTQNEAIKIADFLKAAN